MYDYLINYMLLPVRRKYVFIDLVIAVTTFKAEPYRCKQIRASGQIDVSSICPEARSYPKNFSNSMCL